MASWWYESDVVCFYAGIDYKTKHIALDDETVKLQIW